MSRRDPFKQHRLPRDVIRWRSVGTADTHYLIVM